MARAPSRAGFTLVELLVVLSILGLLVALLLPAIHAVRQVSQRTRCANHLRQLGTALLSYQDTHTVFPPSVSDASGGSPVLHTWLVCMLPYLDQDSLYAEYNFEAGFQSHWNRAIVRRTIPLFVCPSAAGKGIEGTDFGPSNYAGNSGTTPGANDGVLYPASSVRMADILDGSSSTLLVSELLHHNLGWARGSAAGVGGGGGGASFGFARAVSRWWSCAAECAVPGINPPRTDCYNRCEQRFQFSSNHPSGVHGTFADGHVSFLSEVSDRMVLRSLFTRDARD